MNEFNINLVGKEENIKKEEILNNFDFNYLPINNLPISYFPFNNPKLSNEIKIKDIDSVAGLRSDDFDFDYNYIDYIDTIASSGYFLESFYPYKLYIYKSGTNTLKLKKKITCDILVVGGGGSGGWYGGGGGGGGVVYKPNIELTSGIYTITIGEGGKFWYGGRPGGNTIVSFNGSNFLAAGGGGNGQSNGYTDEPIDGIIVNYKNESNSGGGGGASVNRNQGTGNSKSGNGGTSINGDIYSAGGGGGAGGAGGNGVYNNHGDGGIGIQNSITGINEYYGGGGGGGVSLFGKSEGKGGLGGGGDGSSYNTGPGKNGKANTGGGGGGTSMLNYGFGGSGVVIIRVKDYSLDTTNNILTFTANNAIKITKDINVDLLLVGGGGGGAGGGKRTADKDQFLYMGGSGGGGEVIYLKNYKLQKGIYDINIGAGGGGGIGGAGDLNSGGDGEDGKDTYLMKDNNIFLTSRGGNKGNGGNGLTANRFLGGASRKSSYGKGADGNKKYDNSQLGELINIEIDSKYYGNGGKNAIDSSPITDKDKINNGGYGGKGGITGTSSGENGLRGSAGVFILKYKNNDIEFIKKYLISGDELKSKINTLNSIGNSMGISVEPTSDYNPNYKLLFYRGGSNNLILNKDITCDVLIVGGGGGGGSRHAGGGGGGAVIYLQNQTLNKGNYSITIGSGGNGTRGGAGTNGGDSIISFNTGYKYLAKGGGYGCYGPNDSGGCTGGSGGSGGGSSDSKGIASNDNIPVGKYGNDGGDGIRGRTESYHGGGGGGGSFSVGANATLDGSLAIAGNGGDGIEISISGTPIHYGGGGGGGVSWNGKSAGKGGLGGGGDGSIGTATASSGRANTGGGGGGAGFKEDINGQSGAGGSGIVIFRVKSEDIKEGISKDNLYNLIDKDTRIIEDIKNEFNKKMKLFEDDNMPYNKFSIYPLVILIILIWLFIFLFLLKFVHHYFANIYLYILLSFIIILLLIGSMWFLYSNNDL